MGVSFHERMQGDVVDRAGAPHPIDFQISADASDLGGFLRDGTARITGIVHAPPYADHAPVEGTLRISPLSGRSIEYDFDFEGTAGERLRFSGRKDLSLLRPLKSLTRLKGAVTRGVEVIAQGELRFALLDLPAFLRSWWPSSTFRPVDLRRALAEGEPRLTSVLSDRDRAMVEALTHAAIAPGQHVPAPDDVTVGRTLELLGHMPRDVVGAYRMSLRWLDAASVAHTGRRFLSLPGDRQRALLGQLAQGRARGGLTTAQRMMHVLVMPARSAHFSRPDYLRSVGVPDFEVQVSEPAPRWMQQVSRPEELDAETVVEAEVVIVGTGAGGGALAAELARQGVAVALVEEGRYYQRQHFSGSPIARMRRFWRSAGLTLTVGRPPVSIPLGRMVGGTTAINSGTCFRTPDHVLNEWRRDLGFPDDFDPAAMGGRFERVEEVLGVAPSEKRYLGRIADVVARGADGMGLSHGPLPRNAPGCDGQGVCILGCPTGAKRSTDVSYVPRALEAGAALFTGLPVTRLLRRGRRVVGVEARGTDHYGASKRLIVRGEAVVVATGSLITPGLLWSNGFRLPWIGRNLSVHPGTGMWGMFDERMEPWNAVPQGYGVHGYEDLGIRFEGFYLPPQLASSMVPLVGAELTRWMDAQARVGQFGFMVRDEGRGRVQRGLGRRPIVRYSLSRRSVQRLATGSAILAELLIRGGAREVLTGFGDLVVRTVEEARALERRGLSAMDFNVLGAHPLGTCRMGASADRAVVDFEHRVFGTDNLYVVDGSTVPTSLGVNPQVTIMAMATRAAEILGQRLAR